MPNFVGRVELCESCFLLRIELLIEYSSTWLIPEVAINCRMIENKRILDFAFKFAIQQQFTMSQYNGRNISEILINQDCSLHYSYSWWKLKDNRHKINIFYYHFFFNFRVLSSKTKLQLFFSLSCASNPNTRHSIICGWAKLAVYSYSARKLIIIGSRILRVESCTGTVICPHDSSTAVPVMPVPVRETSVPVLNPWTEST